MLLEYRRRGKFHTSRTISQQRRISVAFGILVGPAKHLPEIHRDRLCARVSLRDYQSRDIAGACLSPNIRHWERKYAFAGRHPLPPASVHAYFHLGHTWQPVNDGDREHARAPNANAFASFESRQAVGIMDVVHFDVRTDAVGLFGPCRWISTK